MAGAARGEKWLDVGCGPDKVPGADGIDIAPLPGVDIVADLDRYPWPIADSTYDHVVCKHSISHLANFVRAIEELHRAGIDVILVVTVVNGVNNVTDFRRDVKSNIARAVGLEWLVNRFPRAYERFFAYLLPASEVYFKLRVEKEAA
jgi:ubiquinone/menaquinone biosynthesis C-methylase UbiE